MDESRIDKVTIESWKESHKIAETKLGDNFQEALEEARQVLLTLFEKSNETFPEVVSDEIDKILFQSQMELIMLRAAAYEISK